MKDSRTIRKVLFLSNSNIALVVFDIINNKKVILFANQVNLDGADLKVKINDLLAHAANFLGFYIKEVEVIFDDCKVQSIETKYIFSDCHDKEEIIKAIYRKSKVDKNYVNEIVFNNIEYDDIEKNVIVDCNVIASSYETYKAYIKAVELCNVNVVNAINIYSLLNNKKVSSQIIIKMINNQLVVSEYALAKLNNVTNLNLNMDYIYEKLAKQFNTSNESVEQMINIVNNLDEEFDTDTVVSLSFDLMHKKFNSVLISELVNAYQVEINKIISYIFKLNDYSEVSVITDKAINRLTNANVLGVKPTIGLETIDMAKLIALRKIDSNASTTTQTKFETSVNGKINSIMA